MFIRAYLRASTVEQDAERARELLIGFAAEHGCRFQKTTARNIKSRLHSQGRVIFEGANDVIASQSSPAVPLA